MTSITIEDLQRISNEQSNKVAILFDQEKANRLIEKKEEMANRVIERNEDLNNIKTFIDQTLGDKINLALEPIKGQQDAFEKKTEETFSLMTAEIAAIKEKLPSMPVLTSPVLVPHRGPVAPSPISSSQVNLDQYVRKPALSKIVDAARLTLGFEPIEHSDIVRIAKDMNIADEKK